jgi:predicted ATPase/DNA-binding SARP family transcriptional activator
MLEVRLLGQFEVLRDGRRLTIPTRNAQSLFAYLQLNAGKVHRRERLASMLWPDSSEENARSNLRHELWRLRKTIESEGETYFRIDDLTISFNRESEYSLDVYLLENPPLEGSTADDLTRSISVYQGELLPGFYDEWILVERASLQALFEAKIARLLELLQAEGRWGEILDWAMRWIRVGEMPEPAYRALMVAYANTGNLSKAAATYERFRQGLQKDLGIKPSEQTQALYQRLKTGEMLGVQIATPNSRTQPPKSQADRPSPAFPLPIMRRSNLPKPLTSFIGREKEILHVERIVSVARLVTIVGSGGVGKTRLAIEVAGALTAQFRDGVWWVELATLFETDPPNNRNPSLQRGKPISGVGHEERTGVDLIAQAVAKVLRIPESPGLPLLDEVLGHLNNKKLLLVMDNCEHLIEACATLVERLLSDCPELTILATSREALGVSGEKAWYLPSLSLPETGHELDLKEIYQSEAVSLFVERASELLSGYEPGEADALSLAQICVRLGGIPLAIELAAARMNLLSAQEIAARLDQRFSLLTSGRRTALPRHQTLQAAIEWSYDLLSQAEQVLFRRLSIFAGSFTLEAAEEVAGSEEISRYDVITLLGRLVDKSLLNVEPARPITELSTRYRYLDTIRSFGRLKLDEAEETARMYDRHSAYYVRLVESAEPELFKNTQTQWFMLLQAEHDNLRAVIQRSAKIDQAENALRLVGSMMWPWFSIGSSREGRDLALQALALPSAAQFKEVRARALNTACFMEWALGDMDSARQKIEEALQILKKTNDEAVLAWSMQILGLVLTSEGKYELADKAMKDGDAISRKLGDNKPINLSLVFRGDITLQQGDPFKARRVYEESVNLLRALGNKNFVAYPIRRLGYLALERNDIQQARDYFHESLIINREVGEKRAIAACLLSFAALALRINKPLVAAQLYGAVERKLETLANLLYLDQAELARVRTQLQTQLDQMAFTAAFTEGREMSEDQAIELVEEIIR